MGREGQGRKSKDRKQDKEGRILIKFIEEKGRGIYNRVVWRDEEGEYTFTGGRGNMVINYVMEDIGVRDRIKRMELVDRVDSDHHPIEVWLEGEVRGKRKRGVDRKCWRRF